MFIGAPTTWTTEPQRFAEAGDILMSVRAPVGPVNLATQRVCIGRGLAAIKAAADKLMPSYAFYFLRSQEAHIKGNAGATFASINRGQIEELQIPLPPLEVQKEIVAEIEGHQKVIDGARAVLDNYRPHIPIHPDWPKRQLGSIAENLDSRRVPITKGDRKEGLFPYYGASGIVDHVADYIFDEDILLISEDGANLLARSTPIAFSVSGKCWVNNHAHVLKFDNPATQKFVEVYLNSIPIEEFVTGAAQPKLNQQALNSIPTPIPDDVATQ
jgi:restriction endonuclease S subunit